MNERRSTEREDGPRVPPPPGPGRGGREGARILPGAVVLTGLGVMDAGLVAGGMALGWTVDRHLGTSPVFVLLGVFLGVVLCVLATYTEVKKYVQSPPSPTWTGSMTNSERSS